MNNPLIIGIDPGTSGGVCEIWPDGKIELCNTPEREEFVDFIDEARQNASLNGHKLMFVMELVGGFIAGNPAPGSSMFRMGEGYGFLQGVIAAKRLPLHLVRPQIWQKGIPGTQGVKGPDRKRALKAHACRIHPEVKITLKTCDALLIALWAKANLDKLT